MKPILQSILCSLLPAKLMREWKLLFTSGQPLFEHREPEVTELTAEQVLEEDRQNLLDEGDFTEYKVDPKEKCLLIRNR